MKQEHTEKHIAALMQHPLLSKILTEIPEEVREEVLRCLVSSKQTYQLPSQTEDEAFVQFASVSLQHFEALIDKVINNI